MLWSCRAASHPWRASSGSWRKGQKIKKTVGKTPYSYLFLGPQAMSLNAFKSLNASSLGFAHLTFLFPVSSLFPRPPSELGKRIRAGQSRKAWLECPSCFGSPNAPSL